MSKTIKLLATVFILFTVMLSCEKDNLPEENISVFKAEMKGLNAVPSNISKAEGAAILKYDNVTKRFTANVSYYGLKPNFAHIHMASKEENGKAIIPFRGIIYLPAPLEKNLLIEEGKMLKIKPVDEISNEKMLFRVPIEDLASPIILHSNELTEEQIEALFDGRLYVDFHTNAYPEGEIRGQLQKQ